MKNLSQPLPEWQVSTTRHFGHSSSANPIYKSPAVSVRPMSYPGTTGEKGKTSPSLTHGTTKPGAKTWQVRSRHIFGRKKAGVTHVRLISFGAALNTTILHTQKTVAGP